MTRRPLAMTMLVACASPNTEMAAVSTGSTTTDASTSTSSTSSASTTEEAATSSTSSSTADESSDEGSPFIIDPDGGGYMLECDIWAQDCPRGEKCMPWANDGGNTWNATRCTQLDRMPGDLGDPCTVEDSVLSGIDDCKLGAICWNVDPETLMGECVGFCLGPEANPTCEDPTANCNIASRSVFVLCIPNCDPLAQDCDEGEACYPIADAFRCVPDASGDAGAYGDACRFLHVCDPGLFCAIPEAVPSCGGSGCCTPYCDVSDENASTGCPGFADGQECVAWYEDGQAPPGYEYVGACMVPP